MLLLLFLQSLLYAVFLLLPYSGKLNPHSGKVSYERARQLWEEAKTVIRKESATRVRLKMAAREKARPFAHHHWSETALQRNRHLNSGFR